MLLVEKMRPWPLTTPLLAEAVKRIPAASFSKLTIKRSLSGPVMENFEAATNSERASAPENVLVPTTTFVPWTLVSSSRFKVAVYFCSPMENSTFDPLLGKPLAKPNVSP